VTTTGLRPGSGSSTARIVVVGDESALGVATYLNEEREVLLLSTDPAAVRTASGRGVEARQTRIDDGGRLRKHAVDVDGAVVSTGRDRQNLLVAQLLRTVCDVDDVTVIVNDRQHLDLFEDIDVRPVHGSSLVGPAIDDTLFDDE